MTAKTKLELTWIGKDSRPRLEPRILLENASFSYHSSVRREADEFDNVLIKGDNLLALKALESDYAGKIKCIFIDPPYNTGSAFTHFDDGLEHSIWLSMMRERLELLRVLLADEGSIWITLDDNEAHYFKVLCDEVFGRSNRVATIVAALNPKGRQLSRFFADMHEYVFCYAKNIASCSIKASSEEGVRASDFPLKDKEGAFRLLPLRNTNKKFNPTTRPNLYYSVYAQAGDGRISLEPVSGWMEIWPQFGDGSPAVWRWGRDKLDREKDQLTVKQVTRMGEKVFDLFQRDYLSEGRTKKLPTLWLAEDVGSNDEARREVKAIGADEDFGTPKPERLLRRIIEAASEPGDIVLDSFAGSGTTGAVAHKMGRRWIMVEVGAHCETHIVPRLKMVIDGSDNGGVTEATGWKGGGGFRYFGLAPSLLEKDQFDQWVISKSYNAEMLSEAMCKHFGFSYEPSPEHFWMHGHSSESDFIYVTTASLTHDQLRAISEEVGDERTLLICCKAFQTQNPESLKNLTLRKIPSAVLNRCEWGKDDYSLKIENLPMMDDDVEGDDPQTELFDGAAK